MSEAQQPADAAGIGRRLRECRRAHGLLQQDLATGDISASYVSLIEGGKRRPSDPVLSVLAERVGTTVEYLRTGRDETQQTGLRLELGFAEMALRNGSSEEALQSFLGILARRRDLDPDLLLRARIGQATALEMLGRLEAAISLLHELTEDDVLVPGSAPWAHVHVALCRCYKTSGDLSMSVDVGERALSRLDELGLDVTDDHIMLGVDLVGSYYRRGDLTRGEMLSNRLLAKAATTGSRTAQGMVHWNAALIAESRGRRREAVALVERALGLMGEGENLRLLARLKGLTAAMLIRSGTGDLGRARTLLTQSRETLADVGSVHERGDVEIGLALVAVRTGRFEEGEALAAGAVGLLAGGVTTLSAEAQVALGEAQLLNGRTAEGEASLRAALGQLPRLPRSAESANVCRYLGDVWKRHGNLEQALEAYQHGLDLSGTAAWPSPPGQAAAPRTGRRTSSST